MSIIFPSHPQKWPGQLLSSRLEEYVLDGLPPTTVRRQGAMLVTTQTIASAVTSVIDAKYFVATAFHESNGALNEVDTEIATQDNPLGFMSYGLYQISSEEALAHGFTAEDMIYLDKSTTCMIKLAEQHRSALRWKLNMAGSAPDPDYTDSAGVVYDGGDMRAYLAIAHNCGLGVALRSVEAYGMSWTRFMQRNPTMPVVAHGYGTSCATGIV